MSYVGEKVQSIAFSEAEKKRLSEALRTPNSLQEQVFREKATGISDPRFWRSEQKRFLVTGFRDGNVKAREFVLKRAIEAIRREPDPWRVPIWGIYRQCVYRYMTEDLVALNQLLLREVFEDSNGTLSEQIVRCVKKALPIYSVAPEDATQLYELWGLNLTPSQHFSLTPSGNLN